MAKSIYSNINNIDKKITKMYIGDNDNIAREAKKGYIGDDTNIARLFKSPEYVWQKYTLKSSASWSKVYSPAGFRDSNYILSRTIVTGLTISNGVFTRKTYINNAWAYVDMPITVYFGTIGGYGTLMGTSTRLYDVYDISGYNTFGKTTAYRFDLDTYTYQGSSSFRCTGTLYKGTITNSQGTFVENIISEDPSTYPENGMQDGYWYVKISN